MASPFDVIKKERKKLYIPKTLELANSLLQAFIKNNNLVGLKLVILLSGAKKQIRYDDELQVHFNIDELCDAIKVSRRELSTNLKKMLNVHFTFVDENGDIITTVPIHSYTYKANKKDLTIGISPLAKKLFTELGKGGYSFSQANANNLINLKHKHSLRMQLLLEQISNFDDDIAKRKRFTLKELNYYFGVNYKNFYEFERKILKQVKEQIDNNSTLSFNYEFIEEVNGIGRPCIKEVVIDLKDNTNKITSKSNKNNNKYDFLEYLKTKIYINNDWQTIVKIVADQENDKYIYVDVVDEKFDLTTHCLHITQLQNMIAYSRSKDRK